MKQRRRLLIMFITPNDSALSQPMEQAYINTHDGWYVCEVYRCADEGRRRFRLRARSLKEALERYAGPLLTTRDKEC